MICGQVDQEVETYYCITCGPCLKLLETGSAVIIHQEVEHPEDLIFYGYEENPQ